MLFVLAFASLSTLLFAGTASPYKRADSTHTRLDQQNSNSPTATGSWVLAGDHEPTEEAGGWCHSVCSDPGGSCHKGDWYTCWTISPPPPPIGSYTTTFNTTPPIGYDVVTGSYIF